MAYKTILVHADVPQAAQRLRIAAELAALHEAHLIGVAVTGLPRHVHGGDIASLEDMVLLNQLDEMCSDAQAAIAAFEKAAKHAGVVSREALLIDDDAAGGIGALAPYADLVLLGQPDPDARRGDLQRGLPEHLLLGTGRAVMFIPYAGKAATVGSQPLIAWDGSAGASRAVTGALPMLRQAGTARIVHFNAPRHGDSDGQNASAQLARYLSRHAVRCEILAESTELDMGSALLALASDVFADLLVMGAYGHTRLHDMFMGSASRTVLRDMTLPVLMAH